MRTLDGLGQIVIGGAAGSLGQALLKVLSARNCEVVAICRDKDEADLLQGMVAGFSTTKIEIEVCDLVQHTEVLALAKKYGGVGGLINAAGAFRWAPLVESSESDFELLVNSNLKSTWNLIRAFLPGMIERRFGRMVFVSSKSTLSQGAAGLGLYLAAKSGINMLVQSAAEEVKDLDININAVLPSIIDNPQNRRDMPDADVTKWVTPEGLTEFIAGLLGPAGKHINGALIPISGRV